MINISAPTSKLQQKALDMCLSVPQVMATRIWKIATAPMNSTSQKQEIHEMIAEKETAFMQAIGDISSQIIASQVTLGSQWISDWQRLMFGNHKAFNNFGTHIDKEAVKIMDKGISPYAKTVESNKKRLANNLS